MSKFIEDTKEAIKNSKHSTSDIEFIGDKTRQVSFGTWGRFCSDIEVAEKKRKDNCTRIGYEVSTDLIIAFNDSSLLYRTGKNDDEKWTYLPSKESYREQPHRLDAGEIVNPYYDQLSILKVYVDRQTENYRNEIESGLRTF